MKVVGTIIVASITLATYATNLSAYNYIFLSEREMMCSDWNQATHSAKPSECV
jgi:hypothetical protein